MEAVDAEGAADTDAETHAEAVAAVEMALDADATDDIALDTDATEVPDRIVETDADAVLTPVVKTVESDAEDATLVKMEDTASLEEAAADDAADDAETAEESSLDWASAMAARRSAQRAERRALSTTMAASTSRSWAKGLGESSEDTPWVYIPRKARKKHELRAEQVASMARDGGSEAEQQAFCSGTRPLVMGV